MKITKPGDIAYAPLKSLDSTTPFKQYFIPQEVYADRLAALRARMRAEKLDAVAIYADREHFWNFKYFLGYDPRFEEALLVITQSDPSTALLGNECLSLAKLSPIPVKGVLAQEFSLPNQPMDQHVPLIDLLRAAGIEKGAHVGVIGWKMFTRERGQVLRSQMCVPHFIVEGLRAAAEGGSLENVSDLLIHPDYGIRTINDVHTIAAMEYGASLASDAVKAQMAVLKPGMREGELVNMFNTNGLQHNVHPFALAGANAAKGLICSSDYEVQLGDGLNFCFALEGGLTCRHAYVAEKREDLPADRQDYLEKLVKPYMAAVVSWYENMKIGEVGGNIYGMIQEIFPREEYGWVLNAGHLGANEEWQSSPFYEGSTATIKSGMIMQMDIIPDIAGYHGPNAEDPIAIADENLRKELAEKYPEVYARIEKRRAYMKDEVGIDLPAEVLPLGNLAGEFRPYMMNREMGIKVVR